MSVTAPNKGRKDLVGGHAKSQLRWRFGSTVFGIATLILVIAAAIHRPKVTDAPACDPSLTEQEMLLALGDRIAAGKKMTACDVQVARDAAEVLSERERLAYMMADDLVACERGEPSDGDNRCAGGTLGERYADAWARWFDGDAATLADMADDAHWCRSLRSEVQP